MTQIAAAFYSVPQFLTSLGAKDIIDILVVAFLLYLVFIFIKQTRSFFIFSSFIVLLIIIYLSKSFDLTLTRQLFQPLLTFFLVIFVVIFQREIRRFFDWFSITSKNLSLFREISLSSEVSSSIVRGVAEMARDRTGAIIVLPGEYPLDDLMQGGFPLDGKVSVNLLLSIFDTGSPGHDGAILIKNNRIRTFGLHLPLAETYKNYATFGTRHRAAVGITEYSDALAIVVSEEKGTISLAENGILTMMHDVEELEERIRLFLKENIIEKNKSFWHYLFVNNVLLKVSAVAVACLMWFLFVFQTGTVTREYRVPVEARFLPREYLLQNVAPQEVTVRVSGKNGDLTDFNAQSLKVIFDASNLLPGQARVILDEDTISKPSYVEFVRVSPAEVSVTISDTTSEAAQ